MIDEFSVMESLRSFIVKHLEGYTDKAVSIDLPDPSNMASNRMIYLVHESSEYETLSTLEDQVLAQYTVTLMSKGSKYGTMVKALYETKEKLVSLLRSNQGLDDDATDFISVVGMEFYPSVVATGVQPCIELSVLAQFVKEHD